MPTEMLMTILAAIIAAIGSLGKSTVGEMKDCKDDRALLHAKLTQAVEDCSEDRAVLHDKITELRVDLARVNTHLENTEKKIQTGPATGAQQ